MPDQPKKSERIYVRVTPETKEKLEKLVRSEGHGSLSELLRPKVEELVAKHDRLEREFAGSSV